MVVDEDVDDHDDSYPSLCFSFHHQHHDHPSPVGLKQHEIGKAFGLQEIRVASTSWKP